MNSKKAASRIFNMILGMVSSHHKRSDCETVASEIIESVEPTSEQIVRAFYPDAECAHWSRSSGSTGYQINQERHSASLTASDSKSSEAEAWGDALTRLRGGVADYESRRSMPISELRVVTVCAMLAAVKEYREVSINGDGFWQIKNLTLGTVRSGESIPELESKLRELASTPRPPKPATVTIEVPIEWAEFRCGRSKPISAADFSPLSKHIDEVCHKAVEKFQ